jgi:hypothetical protein
MHCSLLGVGEVLCGEKELRESSTLRV